MFNRPVVLAATITMAAVAAVTGAAVWAASLAVNLIITGDGVWLVVN